MSSTSSVTGAQLVAQTLKHHGITTVFGIIGIPVIEVGQACIDIGIRFVAFRNEQSAAYVSPKVLSDNLADRFD
jgi:2-hydroxyacyl-CoA lyase 1